MDPRDARNYLAAALEEDLTAFAVGVASPELYNVLDRLSRNYQALAICHLLIAGDQPKMRECLVRSAWARLTLLRHAGQETPPPRQAATSYNEALFDALAAGHWDLARRIVVDSPVDWIASSEYLDDFCYFRLVGLLTLDSPVDAATLQALVDRFAQELQGQPSARLNLCKALIVRDAAGFETTFLDCLRDTQERIDEEERHLGEPDEDAAAWWMRRFVSVEALAQLALAERFGIEPAGPYPLVPPGARLRGSCPPFADPFAELEAAR